MTCRQFLFDLIIIHFSFNFMTKIPYYLYIFCTTIMFIICLILTYTIAIWLTDWLITSKTDSHLYALWFVGLWWFWWFAMPVWCILTLKMLYSLLFSKSNFSVWKPYFFIGLILTTFYFITLIPAFGATPIGVALWINPESIENFLKIFNLY